MAVETGELQYLIWDEQGEAVYTSPGLLIGGEIRAAYDDILRRGAGGQSVFSAGPMEFRCTPRVHVVNESKVLIGYAIQSAGALTEVVLKGGTAAYDFLLENAVINSLRVSGAPGEPVVADFDIMGKKETETAVGDAQEAIAGQLFDFYHDAVTIGGSPYKCQSFELEVNNRCRYRLDLDAKDADVKRLPTSIAVGVQEVRLRVSLLEKLTWDVDADAPTRTTAAVIVVGDGTNAITFTFTNLAFTGPRAMQFQAEDGDVEWPYELIGKPGSLVIT